MDLTASAVATVVASGLGVVLIARGAGRRRPHLLAWGVAVTLFAIGCAALVWGTVASWTPGVFRTYYLAGGVLCVPVLGLGSVWLQAPRLAKGLTVVVVAFSVVATPVVVTAATLHPIEAETVPEGRELFDRPPRRFALIGNIAGTALVLMGTVMSIVRASRRRADDPLAGRRLQANLLVTAGVVVAALGGLFLFLGEAASKSVPLALAAILIFLGYLRSSSPVPART